MRVPVRRQPETRVSDRQQGFARAVQPLNVEPLTNLIEGFRNQLIDEQDDRQRVELNRRLLREGNELQADFVRRQTDPEESPIDFARNTEAVYSERHSTILGELRQEGYSEELLEDFEARLGTVRQSFFLRGIDHQRTQLTSRAGEQLEDIGRQSSQYAALDPVNNYATARDMFVESVRTHPDLTEDRRAAVEDEQLAIIRDGAARALAIQNPQLIIDTFDPQGLTAPGRTTTGGAVTAAPNTWQGVATSVASELGLDPVEVAAVFSYESAGSFSPTRMGGTGNRYMGLIQFGPEERRTYGITETSTPEEWTAAILGFMRDRGFRRGMSLLDFYSTINAGQPGRYNASDGPGNTVRTHVDRLLREHRGNAERWLGARAGADARGASQLTGDEVQNVDLPPSQVRQQSDLTDEAGVPVAREAGDISAIVTGNALLDDLNGRERIQLLTMAREQITRVTASQRAEMDVRIGNITAEAMQNGGEIAAPMPTEAEVLQVYGAVEGPQRWAQIQQSRDTGRAIVTFRTRSAADIQTALDQLEPIPGSQTYQTQLQIYQAAERAATALIAQREADPAGYALQHFPAVREAAGRSPQEYYAALDRAYQALGINSSTAPLLTAEASRQMIDQYTRMSLTDRREFLRTNWGMGEERFRRFVQNAPEGSNLQTDARIFALLRSYPQAAGNISGLFEDILAGRDAIREDPARRPRSQDITPEFRTQMSESLRDLDPHASRAIQDAAEALYVRRGGGGTTGNFNSTLYREALQAVLGGNLPVQLGHGQTSTFRTILPAGVTRPQFESWVDTLTPDRLAALAGGARPYYGDGRTQVPVQDIIDEGTFVMTSPGSYVIRMASDGRLLVRDNGRPFIINVDRRAVLSRPRALNQRVTGVVVQ